MGKEKKKSLGIKTARYFTKTCTKCSYEYPNWFTNCPKCGATWDDIGTQGAISKDELHKKTIKIVVKITEEDFDGSLEKVQLIFSADNGKSWYKIIMDNKQDYFLAEIAEVPVGSLIIYYIEVTLVNGEKVIENNEGKYFFYKVGMSLEETENKESSSVATEYETPKELPPKPKLPLEHEHKENATPLPQKIFKPKKRVVKPDSFPIKDISEPLFNIQLKTPIVQPPQTPTEYKAEDTVTIFGKPQTQIDPNLKICPYCNSKIKKMWSTCPICGKEV